ncbi:hypothetical protein Tco_0425255 [Tanacetum coccineum]
MDNCSTQGITPLAALTTVLIDAFATGSPVSPTPINPTYDQAPLGHRAAMLFCYAASCSRASREQYDFVMLWDKQESEHVEEDVPSRK